MIEEELRRHLPKNADEFTRKKQCNFLNNKTNEIVTEAMKIKNLSENTKLTQSEILKFLSKDPEEVKKNALVCEEVTEMIIKEVESMPWEKQFTSNTSKFSKLITKFNKSITKSL